jgi:hypothetical protein
VRKLKSDVLAEVKRTRAKYRPEVVQTYRERGGSDLLPDEYDTDASPAPSGPPSGPVQVSSKAERDALAPGTQYTRPGDSTVYTKGQ